MKSGKALTLRLPEALYEYFGPGDRVFEISGLDWPDKTELDRAERVCLACGNLWRANARAAAPRNRIM